MEIEVGEYIRFDDGKIIKVIKEEVDYYNYLIKDVFATQNTHSIKKYSKYIIDLIEVGDYVNGWKVQNKYEDMQGKIIVSEDCGDSYYDCYAYNEDIESIVTKEQFSQIEYKVKE